MNKILEILGKKEGDQDVTFFLSKMDANIFLKKNIS